MGWWCRTDDPVRDHDSYQIAMKETRPVVGKCDECGCELHSEDDIYEGDDVFLFDDGTMCCDDCLRTYCIKHFRI